MNTEINTLLYGKLPLAIISNSLLAIFLVSVQWPLVSASIATMWLAAMLLVQSLRIFLLMRYKRDAQGKQANARKWLLRFRYGAIATGLLWGVATIALFPHDIVEHQVFLAFVIAGVCAGAVTSLAADRTATIGYILPPLLGLIIEFLLEGGTLPLSMGLMSIIFFIFMLISSELSRQRFEQMIHLRNDALAKQVALLEQQQLNEVITRAQSRFISQSDRRMAFDDLLSDLLALTRSEYGFIGEVQHTEQGAPYLKTYAISNIAWDETTRDFYAQHAPQGMEFFNLDSLFGNTLTSQNPVIANDPAHDERRGGLPEGHPPLNAFLGIPLFHTGQLVAMVGLANRPGGYDHRLLDFLQPLLLTLGQLVGAERIQRQHDESRITLARLSRVAQQTTNGVIITDVEGRVEWTNEGFTRITGYTLDEMRGRRPGDMLQGADSDKQVVALMHAALERHEPFKVDIVNYTKQGQPYWIRIDCNPLYDPQGKLQGFMAIESDVTREKQDAERIREKESRLAAILEGTRTGTWEWNVQTGETRFNQRWAQIIGYRLEELEPISIQTWLDFVHPDDLGHSNELLQRHFKGELDYYDCECRMRHQSGHWVWVRDRGRVISWTEDGKPLLMLGTHTDITAQKHVEQSLRDQAQHTRAILDNMLDGVITIDETGTILSFNLAAERIFGYRGDYVIGQNVSLLMGGPHREQHDTYLANRLQGRGTTVIGLEREVEGRRSDGSLFPLQVAISEISRQGNIEFIGLVRDITAQKQAELELRHAHQQTRLYLETAAVMLFSLDRTGCISMINHAGSKITGYSEAEMLHRNWFEMLCSESDREELQAYYLDVMAGREPLYQYLQSKLRNAHGELRTVYLYGNLLYDETGRITGALFSGEDITDSQRIVQERRRLQQQLAQSQKMEAIGQLTGGIAHDFNNILAGIMGFAELALEHAQEQNDAVLIEFLKPVYQMGERARDLVSKMLAFSRNQTSEHPHPVQLAIILPELLKLLKPVLSNSITLRTELDATAANVLVDLVELQQIMMNLCINARDAMRGEGEITLRVESRSVTQVVCQSCQHNIEGQYTALSIQDTGPGIDPALHLHLFEPFFTTKETGKGSGLGLSMVHGIMHDRGGHILLHSEPGQGATFTLLFPAHAGHSEQDFPAVALGR